MRNRELVRERERELVKETDRQTECNIMQLYLNRSSPGIYLAWY